MKYFRYELNLFIIALISNIIKVQSQLKFKYPISITLSNKNIFVIEEKGIFICSQDFTSIKVTVKTFNNEDKISSLEKYSTVILIKRNDFIISLINYRIYIFYKDGDLLYNSRKLFSDYYPTSISLIPILYSNYVIYYMVAYFDSDTKLNILYYYYDIYYEKNNFIATITLDNLKQRKCYGKSCYYDSSSYHFNFVNSGLSCVDIKDSSYYFDEYFYLVCFFVAKSSKHEYLEELVFAYDDYDIKLSSKFEHDYISFDLNTITQIKADRNDKLDQALVCISTITNNSICYKFKLYNDKADFYKQIKYKSNCKSDLYATKIKYLYEKNVVVFSCLLVTGGIQSAIFGTNLESPTYSFSQLLDCSNIYGHSIIYSSSNKDYFIISDEDCTINNYYTKLIDTNGEKNEIIEEEVKINNIEEVIIKENEEVTDKGESDTGKKIICPEGCKKCSELGDIIICNECHSANGYFPLSNSEPPKLEQCINNEIQEQDFPDYYFDISTGFYRPCYEKCKTCTEKGDGKNNNCITCASGYLLDPDHEYTKNCVPKYKYLYYYDEFNQYTVTDSFNCPENFPIKIKEKNKCVDKCINDQKYNYTYNNICYEQCPHNTIDNDGDYICRDDPTKCVLTKNEFFISNNSEINREINSLIAKYAKEYNYTQNHVSIISLGDYNITLYKNKSCLSELSASSVLLDLSAATSKVKERCNISQNEELIISLIKNVSGYETFEVYNPQTGEPLNIFELCKDDSYSLQKNLIEQLIANSRINFIILQDMANQDINVVDLSDPFYNDICFHYISEFDKDVPLKDRALIYYPNITLCEEGCELEAVYIKNWTAKCNCLFDSGSDKFKDNALYQSQLGEIDELVSLANINVMKCYKDIFKIEYFKKSYGNFIILSLIFVNILCTVIYFIKSRFYIKKYIFNLTYKYLKYLKARNPSLNIATFDNSIKINNINNINNKSNPPPKSSGDEIKIANDNEIINNDNNNNEIDNNNINIINNNENINNQKNINNNDKVNNNENININKNQNINININNNNINNNNLNNNLSSNKINLGAKVIKRNKRKTGTTLKNNINAFNKSKSKSNKNLNNLNSISNNLKNPDLSSSKFIMYNKTKTNINKRKTFQKLNKLSNNSLNSKQKENIISNLEMLIRDDLDITIEEFLKTDPDDMDYDEALRNDDRKFWIYYWEKIQSNQILINTFYFKEYLKPRTIKVMLLALQIGLFFFINGLFYNEEYVKKIFDLEEDTLTKAFMRFTDNLFYAFLVGVIINYIIEFFFIEEKKLRVTLKREKDNILVLKYEMIQIIKDIYTRYLTFIIITFVILLFTWYHLYCFNNIYPHMQKEWLVFSALIILSVQILSLLASLAETILRFLSFRFKSEKLFKLSQLLA